MGIIAYRTCFTKRFSLPMHEILGFILKQKAHIECQWTVSDFLQLILYSLYTSVDKNLWVYYRKEE